MKRFVGWFDSVRTTILFVAIFPLIAEGSLFILLTISFTSPEDPSTAYMILLIFCQVMAFLFAVMMSFAYRGRKEIEDENAELNRKNGELETAMFDLIHNRSNS